MVNPLQAALVSQAAETPGHALKVAHKRKLDKSWQACNQQGIVFLPLAVESLGAWHKSAILEIKKLGSSLARALSGESRGVAENSGSLGRREWWWGRSTPGPSPSVWTVSEQARVLSSHWSDQSRYCALIGWEHHDSALLCHKDTA